MVNLKKTAYERRLDVLEMVYRHKAGHIGSSMSCMDILVSLYYGVMAIEKIIEKSPDRDRFILSKGHSAEALYAVLADRGLIEKQELDTFTMFSTRLAEHPTAKIPGVEIATGALGHGLSAGVGMAMALKKDASSAKVYVLMGDGEQAEGSNWEAAMAAAKYQLGNLICIIDRNCLQISGNTEDIMPMASLGELYGALGWNVLTCSGHDHDELVKAFRSTRSNQPTVIIACTTKGKGSPVTENQADWHHQIPTKEQYGQIKADLLAGLEAQNG